MVPQYMFYIFLSYIIKLQYITFKLMVPRYMLYIFLSCTIKLNIYQV